MSKGLTIIGMRKRYKEHATAIKTAKENGHDMGFWKFTPLFKNVSICYCKKCKREIVCGLPLEPIIGRALKEQCGGNNETHKI